MREGEILLFANRNPTLRREIVVRSEDPTTFLKKHGIKYCPFHNGALINRLVEITHLTVDDVKYDFGVVECGESCRTPVSFDDELIKTISQNAKLTEVKINNGLDKCFACGEYRGKTYLVGSRSPTLMFEKSGRKDGLPVYVTRKECGHNYAFMKIINYL